MPRALKQIFNKMVFIATLALALFLTGCDSNGPGKSTLQTNLPQDASLYAALNPASHLFLLPDYQKLTADNYLKRYFAPWQPNSNEITFTMPTGHLNIINQEQRTIEGYEKHATKLIQENFQAFDEAWFKNIDAQMDLANYPNRNENAITIANTPLRSLPTAMPVFSNPKYPGEGYPFDNLQIDNVWAGTPVHILQSTLDGQWDLVVTPYIYGWVKSTDLALADNSFVKTWASAKFIVPTKDKIPVNDNAGVFRFNAAIGGLYPFTQVENGYYDIMIPVANQQGHAVIHQARIPADSASPFPLVGNQANVVQLMNQLMGAPYGWGGLYSYRDCTETMRDVFASFGVYMPRSSSEQIHVGQEISLKHLHNSAKLKLIHDNAIPFATVIGFPGHVMLYLGEQKGQPIVFEDLWGLQVFNLMGKEGRAIMGGTVIAPLDLTQKGLIYTKSTLDKSVAMTFVVPPIAEQQAIMVAQQSFVQHPKAMAAYENKPPLFLQRKYLKSIDSPQSHRNNVA